MNIYKSCQDNIFMEQNTAKIVYRVSPHKRIITEALRQIIIAEFSDKEFCNIEVCRQFLAEYEERHKSKHPAASYLHIYCGELIRQMVREGTIRYVKTTRIQCAIPKKLYEVIRSD